MFEDIVGKSPNKLAVIDGNTRLSYAEVSERVDTVARALISAGIESGDRVAIWLPNGWQWIVCALAAMTIGAAVVPINTRFKKDELVLVLGKARPKLIFLLDSFLGNTLLQHFRAAAEELARDGCPIPAAVACEETDRAWRDFWQSSRLADRALVETKRKRVDGTAVSDIIFTSGTTGFPKGVITLHSQNLRAYFDTGQYEQHSANDVFGVILPFSHSFGFKAGWMKAFLFGATVCTFPRLDASQLLASIEKHRISFLPGPPTVFYSLLDHPNKNDYDLSSLRLSVVGSTYVPETLVERMLHELHFAHVLSAYGLTEATAVGIMCRIGDSLDAIINSVGRPIHDVEMRIVKPDGHVAGPGEPGEIQMRGYHVMRGYYEDPKETAKAISADGWLQTGDLGELRADGNVGLRGRLRDMLIVGGFNTYPLEIENALRRHEAVADVAIVGMPDARLGEVPAAFVILRDGCQVSSIEMRDWAAERIANYKVPRAWHFLRDFPTNASGKVLKRELEKILLDN